MEKEQFTLEAAQQGKELVTRNGKPARYIAMLQRSNPQFPLVVEVLQNPQEKKEEKQVWTMENYAVTGEHLPPFEQPLDLFIKTL